MLLLSPDQCFMRIGETHSPEIWHGIGLGPHHVIEDPEIQVLQGCTHPKDIVISANDPDGAGFLQHPAAGGEPFTRETVVLRKAGEPVPIRIHSGNFGLVGAPEILLKL